MSGKGVRIKLPLLSCFLQYFLQQTFTRESLSNGIGKLYCNNKQISRQKCTRNQNKMSRLTKIQCQNMICINMSKFFIFSFKILLFFFNIQHPFFTFRGKKLLQTYSVLDLCAGTVNNTIINIFENRFVFLTSLKKTVQSIPDIYFRVY